MAISIEQAFRDDGQVEFSVLLPNTGLADGIDLGTQDATLATIRDALRINRLGAIAYSLWDFRHVTILVRLAGNPLARNLHIVRDRDDWDAADPRPALIAHYIRIGFESLPRPWGSS